MKYTSIIEKILCLLGLISKSWDNILFLVLALILIVLLLTKRLSTKKCIILILISYLLLLANTIYNYNTELETTLNSLTDNLFTTIYFPSTHAYLFILITINLTTLISLLNIKCDKIYRTINTIAFFLVNFILTLILEIISKNKIDIFSKSSLFSNTDLVILLELSINIFIVWLISLSIVYLTNIVTEKILVTKSNKELAKKPATVLPQALEVDVPNFEEEYLSTNDNKQEESYASNFGFKFIPQKETTIMEETKTNLTNELDDTLVSAITASSEVISSSNDDTLVSDLTNNFADETNSILSLSELTNNIVNKTNNTLTSELDSIETTTDLISQVSNPSEHLINISLPHQNTLISEVSNTLVSETISSVNSNTFDTTFDLSSFIPRKKEVAPITREETDTIFNQILNNELPLIKEEPVEKVSEKDSYTLNDYRIFNKMLREIKEHNNSNIITIDKNLEYRLITKYSNETYLLFKKMLKNYSN